jgi:hypothetical protein
MVQHYIKNTTPTAIEKKTLFICLKWGAKSPLRPAHTEAIFHVVRQRMQFVSKSLGIASVWASWDNRMQHRSTISCTCDYFKLI